MDGLDAFLDAYGLAALFVVMLVKAIGVPLPVPSDIIMLAAAARAAEGKLTLWQAFVAILVALILGGVVQYGLVRGGGRTLLYRFGRFVGLTEPRLDAAAARVQRGGSVGIGIAIFTPGVRSAAVAACGLAGIPLQVFVVGLTLGSVLFLTFHFAVGFLGGQVLAALGPAQPWPAVTAATLLVGGFAVWLAIRRRTRPEAAPALVLAEAFESWHEATCPACLALGIADHVRGAGAPAEPHRHYDTHRRT